MTEANGKKSADKQKPKLTEEELDLLTDEQNINSIDDIAPVSALEGEEANEALEKMSGVESLSGEEAQNALNKMSGVRTVNAESLPLDQFENLATSGGGIASYDAGQDDPNHPLYTGNADAYEQQGLEQYQPNTAPSFDISKLLG